MTATMRDQAAATVCELFAADERVAVVLAEISTERFEPAVRHDPRRAVNLGIMEQTMVGVAAGFALEGFHPVVHTIDPFLTERALEQVKDDFGNQELPGTLVTVGASFDYGQEGTTHHAPGSVQAMLSIPRMDVVVPGTAAEVDTAIRAGVAGGRLTYVRTSVRANAAAHPAGLVTRLREGRAATVLAIGPMLERTLAATAGLDVTVAYTATIAPLDAAGLAAIAAPAAEVVTVVPFFEGTTAHAVAAALAGRPRRFLEIGVPRRVVRDYGTPAEHDDALGLDPTGIRGRIQAFIAAPAASRATGR